MIHTWIQQRRGSHQNDRIDYTSTISLLVFIYRNNKNWDAPGLQLMPEISQISDLNRLKAIQRGILTSNTLEEFRQLIF